VRNNGTSTLGGAPLDDPEPLSLRPPPIKAQASCWGKAGAGVGGVAGEPGLPVMMSCFLLNMASNDLLLNVADLADEFLKASVPLGVGEHLSQQIDRDVQSPALLAYLEHQVGADMLFSSGALAVLFIAARSPHAVNRAIDEGADPTEASEQAVASADEPSRVAFQAVGVTGLPWHTDRYTSLS